MSVAWAVPWTVSPKCRLADSAAGNLRLAVGLEAGQVEGFGTVRLSRTIDTPAWFGERAGHPYLRI